MNTNTEALNNIEVRPTGRGRPVNKNTARARSATIRAIVAFTAEDGSVRFSARDLAGKAKVGRAKVALALRWLDHQHGAVVPVDTTHQERRARPELVYMLADEAPKEAIKARDARNEELANRAAARANEESNEESNEEATAAA